MSDVEIVGYLAEVYSACAEGAQDRAVDLVFDRIDRLLIDGEYEVVDDILRLCDVGRLSTHLMRSFLTITAPGRHRLPSRPKFFDRVEAAMTAIRGAEVTRRLIGVFMDSWTRH